MQNIPSHQRRAVGNLKKKKKGKKIGIKKSLPIRYLGETTWLAATTSATKKTKSWRVLHSKVTRWIFLQGLQRHPRAAFCRDCSLQFALRRVPSLSSSVIISFPLYFFSFLFPTILFEFQLAKKRIARRCSTQWKKKNFSRVPKCDMTQIRTSFKYRSDCTRCFKKYARSSPERCILSQKSSRAK